MARIVNPSSPRLPCLVPTHLGASAAGVTGNTAGASSRCPADVVHLPAAAGQASSAVGAAQIPAQPRAALSVRSRDRASLIDLNPRASSAWISSAAKPDDGPTAATDTAGAADGAAHGFPPALASQQEAS